MSAADKLTAAVVARDFDAAAALLAPDAAFRAMTPNRIWEAPDPAGVAEVLRTWIADPDEAVHAVEAVAPDAVADTARVGWRVHGTNADGEPFVFEQLAYVREDDEGRITWLRIMCSGPRDPAGAA